MRQLKIHSAIIDRDPSVKFYLKEISKYKPLTLDEEMQLGLRIQKGDQQAIEDLVNANLRFVVSVASQYHNATLELLDLISEGNFGLIKAAQTFDPTRGFKFISYAVFWIRQAIISAIVSQGHIVRLPSNKMNLLKKIFSYMATFEQEHERQPSADEIAEHLGISVSKVNEVLDVSGGQVSLSKSTSDGERKTTREEMLVDEDAVPVGHKMESDSEAAEIRRSLKEVLDPREHEFVVQSFGIGQPQKSLDEIAMRNNICKQRCRQIVEMALMKMRHSRHAHLLRHFL